MRKSILFAIGSVVLSLFSAGCVNTVSSSSFFGDPSVDRSALQINRVAIVPNRLPLNLTNEEFWRQHNWTLARAEFVARGFDVVDYATSVRTFQESGLPVEDTPASRDKFAVLAEQLAVDVIVVPFYGTTAHTAGSFVTQEYNFDSQTTFQFYFAETNSFGARMDASGTDSYRTWGVLAAIVGVAAMILADDADDAAAIIPLLFLGASAVDTYQSIYITPNIRWQRAFRKSIQDGLAPFFVAFAQ